MSIQVALHHQMRYRYGRAVALSPHEIRLRPAPHCRTPVLSYSLNVDPENHFINWHQDAFGNHIARFVFPEKTTELVVTVDLVADMVVINPFDFLVEPHAERYPFTYRDDLAADLAPFLTIAERGPLLNRWVEALRSGLTSCSTIDFLVDLNRRLQSDMRYLVRMEPGVQTCEQTLERGSGSCRDTGWLLVQILRHLGVAARFVSGYLIQLVPDVTPPEGPAGPERDHIDLHAWAEVYLPGAGWIGLDPTSGLLAGEGHIPVACAPSPSSAAPVSGSVEVVASQFDVVMTVTRLHEDTRITRPYSDSQWQAIDELGKAIDAEIEAGDMRLTHGGEPTFVAADEIDQPEWNTAALSEGKWRRAEQLAWSLRKRFAPGGIVFYGQGKWYPEEAQPRWSLGVYWRNDGLPVWRNPELIANESSPAAATLDDARRIAIGIAETMGFHRDHVIEAYEDPLALLQTERRLPVNVDLRDAPLATDADRAGLARSLERGWEQIAALVLPLRARHAEARPRADTVWESSPWPLRRERLYLLPGTAPAGCRLPIASLPELLPAEFEPDFAHDPFDARGDLHDAHTVAEKKRHARRKSAKPAPREVVRTALCVEVRGGRVHVFLPPLLHLEDFLNLMAVIERVAERLGVRVRAEGYGPPVDPRLKVLSVTPDPGVIEVNLHAAVDWKELCQTAFALYEEARAVGLVAEKFTREGRHTGTGGGNHVTLGGPTPADSPLLRRPDLLRSLITYWQNHPALSYLFSGLFIGPTSQAPRVDEARDDNLYELEIAFQQLARLQPRKEESRPWLVDRLLRNLLVDLTGNTHRAEFCIDKLYSPDGPTGRLGLLEFRAFEMPPHPHMYLAQMLLLRALAARFWKTPYGGRLIRWGTELHDRFMLPHFIAADMHDVATDLQRAGHPVDFAWFAPFFDFRFPRFGSVVYDNVRVEIRHAIEPWHVLGEEVGASGNSREVDSSVERLQVKVDGLTASRHLIACNGRALPLHPTGVPGEFVCGVRYRARSHPKALHPTIDAHVPLVFDVVDTWSERSIGGCTYHVSHPGGHRYDRLPVNASEAEARRIARFWDHGHTPGPMVVRVEPPNPGFPLTLDLRREAG